MRVPVTIKRLLLNALLFWLAFLGISALAQAQLSLQHLPPTTDISFPSAPLKKEAPPGLQQAILRPGQLPSAYAYKDLAFFCKLEVQLESSLSIPFKIRLGSVDYVNYLEQKNPYQRW